MFVDEQAVQRPAPKSTIQKVKKSSLVTLKRKRVSGRPRYPETLIQRNVKLTERQVKWLLAGSKNVSERLRVLLDWVMQHDPNFYAVHVHPGAAATIENKSKQVKG
jgi:hypothetical protein